MGRQHYQQTHYKATKNLLRVESQFLKWVLDWDSRVFPSLWKGQHQYCFNGQYCQQMDKCVHQYLNCSRDELGQDRLAWTVFTNALLKEHGKTCHYTSSCSLKKCLYVVIWISFYLNLSDYNLIQKVLREILICNGNLKSLFTFLPGMPISLYVSKFLEDNSNFEDVLCHEFFSMLSQDNRSTSMEVDVYRRAQPLIYYQVSNLRPLHDGLSYCIPQKDIQKKPTLIDLLNQEILPYHSHNILTLAIEFRDIPLINLLLSVGASASFKLWDPVKEETITPERMMISNINSIMFSQQILTSREYASNATISSLRKMKDDISGYGRKLTRSLLKPECKKANNVWEGEKWRTELNKEVADEWGIGFHQPFPSLQHMSKICIRQQILISDRELLSVAVNRLPIPNLLKCYLNLELD